MQTDQSKKKVVSRYIHEDEAFWKKHQSSFAISGLNRKRYSHVQGIDYDRFSYWLKKLFPAISAAPANQKHSALKKPSFMPVQVKLEPKQNSTLCSLTLRNGLILKIHDQSALSFIIEKVM